MIGVLLVCGLSIHPSIGKRLEKIDEYIFNFRLLIRNPILFFSAKPDDSDFSDDIPDIPVPEPTVDLIKDESAPEIDSNIEEPEPTIDNEESNETNAQTDFAQEVLVNMTIEEEHDASITLNNTEEVIPECEQENTTLVTENPIPEPVIEQTDAEDANIDQETLESNEDEPVPVPETPDIASSPRISVLLEQMNSHKTSSFIRLLRCFGGSFNDLGIPKRGSEFWETSGRHVNYTFRFQESDVIGVEFLYSGTDVCQSHNYSAVGIPGALQNDVFIFDQPHRLNQVVITATNDGDESKSCLYGCNMLVRQQE